MERWEADLVSRLGNNGRNKENENKGIRVGSDLHLAEMAYTRVLSLRKRVKELEDDLLLDTQKEPAA